LLGALAFFSRFLRPPRKLPYVLSTARFLRIKVFRCSTQKKPQAVLRRVHRIVQQFFKLCWLSRSAACPMRRSRYIRPRSSWRSSRWLKARGDVSQCAPRPAAPGISRRLVRDHVRPLQSLRNVVQNIAQTPPPYLAPHRGPVQPALAVLTGVRTQPFSSLVL